MLPAAAPGSSPLGPPSSFLFFLARSALSLPVVPVLGGSVPAAKRDTPQAPYWACVALVFFCVCAGALCCRLPCMCIPACTAFPPPLHSLVLPASMLLHAAAFRCLAHSFPTILPCPCTPEHGPLLPHSTPLPLHSCAWYRSSAPALLCLAPFPSCSSAAPLVTCASLPV